MQNTLHKSFDQRYAKLNSAQKLAVDTIEGPVLVVAGPGTGKTELLSLRTANILKTSDVSASQILCLTFTENGAKNMRERLMQIIGKDAYKVGIYTFHGFCNQVIARFPQYFYNHIHFSQAGDPERYEIFDSIFRSLPHGHPLSSYHPEKGFSFLGGVMERISQIKNFGQNASQYRQTCQALLAESKAVSEIIFKTWPKGRLGIKTINTFEPVVEAVAKLNTATSAYYGSSLSQATLEAIELGKTEPISKWRTKNLVKKDDDKFILKDTDNEDKIMVLCDIFQDYQAKMHEQALFDFDDTLVEVLHAIKTHSEIRSELEEQYQYIMIDEFQDTNEAQMGIVRAMSSNEVYEGSPNVCVVGDDDQAIYKFQGAEVSHIMHFRDSVYKNVKTIVLDKNYRSNKAVLDLSRQVIVQAGNRLENKYQEINKLISPVNESLPEGTVSVESFASDIEEYSYVAERIAQHLKAGVKAEEIAVLSRKHDALKSLLPFLDQGGISYEYVKKSNVFDEAHIKEIITICEYVASISDEGERKDYLLPEIIASPVWGIDRKTIFDIAIKAKDSRSSWLGIISQYDHEEIKNFLQTIEQLSENVQNLPIDRFIDKYINNSNFKEYYFSQQKLKQNANEYVYFLANLKTFLEALREYRSGQIVYAKDIGSFVEIYKTHNLSLVSQSPFVSSEQSVKLMTAHASKGLEFEVVFIIGAHQRAWSPKAGRTKAPVPKAFGVLIEKAGDDSDDFIRLLYVAMTRAKHTLYVTGHQEYVEFLAENAVAGPDRKVALGDHENILGHNKLSFSSDEKNIFARGLEDYRMPVTHLNNFLDIISGGPIYFIEQNLLRFPQPINVSGAFGSAMHKAIESYITYPKFNAGDKPSQEYIASVFAKELSKSRLEKSEYNKQLQRGIKKLEEYIDERGAYFKDDDQIEVDMKDAGVFVGEAHLTGKLDFVRIENGKIIVKDFKTGKDFDGFEDQGKKDFEKIKAHRYKMQLIFYKILLEASDKYKQYEVGDLSLEFVESSPVTEIFLECDQADIERAKKLIEAVYNKIISLDFPDTQKYSKDYKGLLEFEEDLLQ